MAKDQTGKLPSERYDIYGMFTTRQEVVRLKGAYTALGRAKIKKASRLPLVVRQNVTVQFEDQYFRLAREGLYRFANWGKVRYDHPRGKPEIINARKSCTSVILFKKDILSLFGAFAALTVHGHTHNPASHKKRLARMKLGGVALTCGCISQFMCTLLPGLGFKTRMVYCLRTEGVYDTYDCGHALFEFYWPTYRKWVLADVDIHRMFVRNGEYLNMAEVKDLVDHGKSFTLEPLTPAGLGLIDTTEVVTSNFTGMSLFDHTLTDTDTLKAWYRTHFAAVALEDIKIFYCPDPNGQKRIKMYCPDAQFMRKETWVDKYYRSGG